MKIAEIIHNIFSKIEGEKKIRDDRISRIWFVTSCFGIAFTLSIFKLANLSIIEHNQPSKKPSKIYAASRGNIYDRNDNLIATNVKTASIYANPKELLDCENASEEVIRVFPELNAEKLRGNFCNKSKSFTWIKHNLTPRDQYKINSLGIPGIYFQNNYKRVYPEGNLTSHILGFVGLDGEGLSGIEKQFDEQLQNGEDVKLSIDIRLQNIVRDELNKTIQEYNSVGGSAILLDSNNGEILSMISMPDFNPHSLNKIDQNSLLNRSTLALYEIGSTFKPFTLATALDKKTIGMSDYYQVGQRLKAARFSIGDYSYKGDYLSVPEIMMYSSNIGTAKIALDVGAKGQKEYLSKLGLLEQTKVEIPERSSPMYPKNNWADVSVMTISYGHGIAITPLHAAQAMVPVVNGGKFYNATLLKTDEEPEYKQIFNPKTSVNMRKLLRAVAENGTARRANSEGYVVGAKTGTGNKPSAGGGYDQSLRVSSTVAAFPIHDPKYVLFVIVDEPKGKTNIRGAAVGGRVAAPMVKKIIPRIAPILGISPVKSGDKNVERMLHIEKSLLYKPKA